MSLVRLFSRRRLLILRKCTVEFVLSLLFIRTELLSTLQILQKRLNPLRNNDTVSCCRTMRHIYYRTKLQHANRTKTDEGNTTSDCEKRVATDHDHQSQRALVMVPRQLRPSGFAHTTSYSAAASQRCRPCPAYLLSRFALNSTTGG